MFCHNCGKEIPDGATFCHYCGAEQTAAKGLFQANPAGNGGPSRPEYQEPALKPAARQQKPKKKWTAILIPVLVFFICAMLGKFVIAPSFRSDSGSDSTAASSQPLTEIEELQRPDDIEGGETDSTEESGTNQAYTDLFLGTKIIHLPVMFGMDMECFAMKDENGNVICRDYGYQGDQVLAYVETWYYPGITADQQETIQAYTEIAKEDAAGYDGVACANITYSYNEANEYFVVKYEFTDLDQPANCQALYDLGITTGADGLSLSKCEELAIADGFIKR